ncbi:MULTISPECIES: selenide, water dikinase SelD [unclassified Halomonas]|mgnify:FL=1|uniref:selenide, water dikinase SelD n=1 Tax=unclassified Halomonas TaxID=2609666 RepID=UPI001EF63E67|nr:MULTISPECIES: selenide, water dikinase SelD [unclassified Halomonas]MCG7577874.1 selenide, water dikinase SelD [Halomonas sp. MMH1-48]MCG7604940.1 selenide, water dikinase SelD [Halomonas sp. MM17-34]MCG7614094.1 selenide, water dikinase SelD [Halomonas sp. MM17-29]MCG7621059.1 selenide, water dikinase SelD [Halomonas sp. DSH1-27]
MSSIRLTQYSHGAGCGCKIAPDVLDGILAKAGPAAGHQRLIVGNQGREDAAVYDLGDGRGMIATTDFFMPIVDDPFDFGRIAATNAISDVYAMGGTPVMALGILGWPLDKLGPDIAGDVVAGAQAVCRELGIALAGGHSIDAPEPMFGLAVNGLVDLDHLKLNSQAKPGDLLFLTKPLGVGILTTAEKRGLLEAGHHGLARETMLKPNAIGVALAQVKGVNAMTDVTGFGLAGHLNEMCSASGVMAEIDFRRLPRLAEAEGYRRQGAVPGGAVRNRDALGSALPAMDDAHWQWLCDPQTSGGLLISVDPAWEDDVERIGREHGLTLAPFGTLKAALGKISIEVVG